MSDHRWEWTLPGDARAEVAAILDPITGIETVLVDGRVASSAARGAMPNGHVITLPGAPEDAEKVVVSFDPRLVICILRVGREEVTPKRWPAPQRAKVAPPPRAPIAIRVAGAVLAVAVLGGGAAFVLATRTTSRPPTALMTGVHRADNGLFVAHFPTHFMAHPALVPGASGVVLEDRARSEAIVIVALAIGEGLDEPWAIQQRIHDEALTNLPRGGGAHQETSRTDGTCLGQPGALVLGRVTASSGTRANLWSCAFRLGPAGYLVMYAVPENDTSGAAARLQSVVDSTELTRLGDLTGGRP
jgi:hypothetical protein